ncbi:MAG: EAL domain-containing protein [gamma proteobacterium symbiont of Bathyaustriella thionipta]|nr:EAL domain-containing protein [gamma proteobacterium symbiont of Bathyaustriella thionipta]
MPTKKRFLLSTLLLAALLVYLVAAAVIAFVIYQPPSTATSAWLPALLWSLPVAAILGLAVLLVHIRQQRMVLYPLTELGHAIVQIASNADTRERLVADEHSLSYELATQINRLLDVLEGEHFAAENEKSRLLQVLDSVSDAVFQIDANGVVRYMNPAVKELLEHSPHDLLRKPIEDCMMLIDDMHQKQISNPAYRCLTVQEALADRTGLSIVLDNGKRKHVRVSATPLFDMTGLITGCLLQVRDTSETSVLQQQLTSTTRFDNATGLPNREEFISRIEKVASKTSRGEMIAVLSIDVDHFAMVNDGAGRAAGDELLSQLGALFYVHVDMSDEVARIGTDEFGIMLTAESAQRATAIAESLIKAANEFRFKWEGKSWQISLSIGVAVCEKQHQGDAAGLIVAADAALQLAKLKGGGRYVVHSNDDPLLAEHTDTLKLYTDVTQALELERFSLYFQGIFALKALGEMRHIEILLRMLDAENRPVPPDLFVPVAERYGLAVHVDRWVISHTFEFFAKHPQVLAQLDMISVNLSGASISDENTPQFIVSELDRHKLKGDKFCIEFTETAAIANVDAARALSHELRRFGFSFALDDFGTGMASFSYLKNFDVDYLKIDGSFVRHLHNDKMDHAIVKAFSDIAASIPLKTIAEFVENEPILDVLETMGITYAQGFHLHKPTPLEKLILSDHR